MELIHDLRNNIQHKGAVASEEETEFYMKTGYNFLKRFLKHELGVDVTSLLDSRYREVMESPSAVTAKDLVALPPAKSFASDLVSVMLVSFRNLEVAMLEYFRLNATQVRHHQDLQQAAREVLVAKGVWTKRDLDELRSLREVRNKYAHTSAVPNLSETEAFAKAANRLMAKLFKAEPRL